MKPIAQTFIVNQPETGVDAVFLTKVDIYFNSVSTKYGIELQVREVENGYPTQKQLPYASKILSASEVVASSTAITPTTFTFDTPVLIRTNEQFALVLVPVAGNPDYTVWTAALAENDVSTGTPIYTNNQLGSLFISSNDLNFTPIQNESIKYNLYTAQFTATSAVAVYKNSDSDTLSITKINGSFVNEEQVFVANNRLRLAAIPSSASFTVGEIVVQPNTATSVYDATAFGKYLGKDGGNIILINVGGSSAFSNTGGGLKGLTSSVTTANFSGSPIISTNTFSNSTISVATANTTLIPDFAVNNYIYIGTNNRSTMQVVKITGIDNTNKKITVDANVNFSDNFALIGRVKADANLYGYFTATSRNTSGPTRIILKNVTANTSQNFANSTGIFLIGRSSGASAIIKAIYNQPYHSITNQFTYISPKQTTQNWSFTGVSEGKTTDSTPTTIRPDVPTEFIDTTRMLMSISNEYVNPASAGVGSKSLVISANLSSANNKISPYIDVARNHTHLTRNIIKPSWSLTGYLISYANNTLRFNSGDTVWQSNSTVNTFATIISANTDSIWVANVISSNVLNVGMFNANGTSIITSSNTGAVANVIAITTFSETSSNVNASTSKYISKNVILADQQDAEDLVCYLGAYRPPNTNFKVYGKFLNGSDADSFVTKSWSALIETSSPALLSSLVNRDDIVELSYNLPVSVQIYGSNAVANSGTNTIQVDSTASFSTGQFIYFADTTTGSFNVRQITGIANSRFLNLNSAPSVNTTNASVGYIPNMESQTGAFRYANNNGIIRYCTSNDGVYDSFKTFAVKVVLVSDSQQIVPRMTDMRCLALQV